ncbi:hypothetical protein HNQ59_003551 [Chitinivorax tropicus]|uniref:NADAR domain-containing protein n=1 Tax=Chitinivorax tropicus TaxID=714531 RepID=A0A840MM56_9PROT|nr:NADAR family protein [Chitinivorax tropicus]MBB5020234.1 hypothetical protein [Chitinivorax tropicus]
MISDRDSLIAQVSAGHQVPFLHFWGHQPNHDGSPGKGCLSQWFPASFELDGDRYATAEHYMMAEKARLFSDEPIRQAILATPSPAEAKKLGRKIRGFHDQTWVDHRLDIVLQGNLAKFRQHAAMRAFLLSTGEQVLVEASPTDAIWGIGLSADHAHANHPGQWPGLNLLGFVLMAVRDRLLTEPL